jgi:hypothetical protein
MEAYIAYPTKEQEKAVEAFFLALNIAFEKRTNDSKLPDHVIAGINRGLEDMAAGRTITLEEFKKKLFVSDEI